MMCECVGGSEGGWGYFNYSSYLYQYLYADEEMIFLFLPFEWLVVVIIIIVSGGHLAVA